VSDEKINESGWRIEPSTRLFELRSKAERHPSVNSSWFKLGHKSNGHFDRLKPSKTLETDLTKFSQDDITHVLASHIPTKPPELRLT